MKVLLLAATFAMGPLTVSAQLSGGASVGASANVTGIRLGAGPGSNDTAVNIGPGLTLNLGTGTLSSTGSGGTVTSVAMTVPYFLSVTGSPVTGTGTFGLALSGSPLLTANGGTGLTSLFPFAPLIAGATPTSAMQNAATNQANVGYVLTSTGNSSVPIWQQVLKNYAHVTATSTTALSGQSLWLDAATGGAMTTKLPASPNDGDTVIMADLSAPNGSTNRGWSTANQTVAGNGHNIEKPDGTSAPTATFSRDATVVTFIYLASDAKWQESVTWPVTYVAGGSMASGSITITNAMITPVPPPRLEHAGTSLTNAGSLYLYSVSTGTATFKSTNTSDNDTTTLILP